MEDIRKDVMERLTGAHRDTIEKVVSRLRVLPCPNSYPAISAMSSHEIIDLFGMNSRHSKTAPLLIMTLAVGRAMT